MAIRYDKKLNQEINRVIKNFNQKVARLEKKEKELLPQRISKQELKENVYTRKELYRRLKELQTFSKRGAEELIETKSGARLTKYEFTKLKKETTRIKKNLTREINRLKVEKPKLAGKVADETFARMGDTTYLNLIEKRRALEKNILSFDKEELKRFSKMVARLGHNKDYYNYVFKDNYLSMLTELGYFTGYDSKKLELIKQKLNKLEPTKFYKMFQSDKYIQAILSYYPMMTNMLVTQGDISDDVNTLYDDLLNNIDNIVQDYA